MCNSHGLSSGKYNIRSLFVQAMFEWRVNQIQAVLNEQDKLCALEASHMRLSRVTFDILGEWDGRANILNVKLEPFARALDGS